MTLPSGFGVYLLSIIVSSGETINIYIYVYTYIGNLCLWVREHSHYSRGLRVINHIWLLELEGMHIS